MCSTIYFTLLALAQCTIGTPFPPGGMRGGAFPRMPLTMGGMAMAPPISPISYSAFPVGAAYPGASTPVFGGFTGGFGGIRGAAGIPMPGGMEVLSGAFPGGRFGPIYFPVGGIRGGLPPAAMPVGNGFMFGQTGGMPVVSGIPPMPAAQAGPGMVSVGQLSPTGAPGFASNGFGLSPFPPGSSAYMSDAVYSRGFPMGGIDPRMTPRVSGGASGVTDSLSGGAPLPASGSSGASSNFGATMPAEPELRIKNLPPPSSTIDTATMPQGGPVSTDNPAQSPVYKTSDPIAQDALHGQNQQPITLHTKNQQAIHITAEASPIVYMEPAGSHTSSSSHGHEGLHLHDGHMVDHSVADHHTNLLDAHGHSTGHMDALLKSVSSGLKLEPLMKAEIPNQVASKGGAIGAHGH